MLVLVAQPPPPQPLAPGIILGLIVCVGDGVCIVDVADGAGVGVGVCTGGGGIGADADAEACVGGDVDEGAVVVVAAVGAGADVGVGVGVSVGVDACAGAGLVPNGAVGDAVKRVADGVVGAEVNNELYAGRCDVDAGGGVDVGGGADDGGVSGAGAGAARSGFASGTGVDTGVDTGVGCCIGCCVGTGSDVGAEATRGRFTKAGLPQEPPPRPPTGPAGRLPMTLPEPVPGALVGGRLSYLSRLVLENVRCRGGLSRAVRRYWQSAHMEASCYFRVVTISYGS